MVFHETQGFRDDSIDEGVAAITQLGADHGFEVVEVVNSKEGIDDPLDQESPEQAVATAGGFADALSAGPAAAELGGPGRVAAVGAGPGHRSGW